MLFKNNHQKGVKKLLKSMKIFKDFTEEELKYVIMHYYNETFVESF